MILILKLQKYLSYHQEKLITTNILQAKKYCFLMKKKKKEQAKITYSPLGKPFKEQV